MTLNFGPIVENRKEKLGHSLYLPTIRGAAVLAVEQVLQVIVGGQSVCGFRESILSEPASCSDH